MRGHEFTPDDASYLVHLYEEMGYDFLERLNGAFSGVLLDLREQKFVLFNDRYGVNRIYYHEDKAGFYFSSEAKALLKILPAPVNLICVAWANFSVARPFWKIGAFSPGSRCFRQVRRGYFPGENQ